VLSIANAIAKNNHSRVLSTIRFVITGK
jgi:hypothetical protein